MGYEMALLILSLQPAPACIRHLEAVGKSPSRETGGMQALRALHPPERSVRGVVVQGGGCYAMCKHDRPWLDGQKWAKKDLHLGLILAAGISRLGVLAQRRGGNCHDLFFFFSFFLFILGEGEGGSTVPCVPLPMPIN